MPKHNDLFKSVSYIHIVKQYIATKSDIAHVYFDVERSPWHVIKYKSRTQNYKQ